MTVAGPDPVVSPEPASGVRQSVRIGDVAMTAHALDSAAFDAHGAPVPRVLESERPAPGSVSADACIAAARTGAARSFRPFADALMCMVLAVFGGGAVVACGGALPLAAGCGAALAMLGWTWRKRPPIEREPDGL